MKRLLKRCPVCGKRKPLNEFRIQVGKNEFVQSKGCRDCVEKPVNLKEIDKLMKAVAVKVFTG